jgi:signal peptidase I
MDKQWMPKGWLAIVFAIFLQPFTFLYVNKQKLFWFYTLLAFILMLIDIKFLINAPNTAWYKGFYFSWGLFLILPAHAYISTKNYDVTEKRSWYASWWGSLLCFIFTLITVISVRVFYIDPISIPADSMSPTLNRSDIVLVNKQGYGNYRYHGFQLAKSEPSESPDRGDIIVFQSPKNPKIDFIKRVIGLPGDKVVYRDKNIYIKEPCLKSEVSCSELFMLEKSKSVSSINGFPIYEEKFDNKMYSVIIDPQATERSDYYFNQDGTERDEWIVPDEHYFVLGDNRDNSLDSRFFGFVPKENIIGKPLYIW